MGRDGLAVTAPLPASATLREDLRSTSWGKAQREEREMIRKHFRFKRVVLGLALGLVFAAIAAPAALAKPVSSDTLNGGFDPWAYSLVHQSTQPSSPQVVDLGPLDPWAYSVIHGNSATPPATAIRGSSSPSGFDWSDAGVGAGVSFGVVLILLASVGFGVKYRRIHRSGLATS
jgi:hypothetical protein